MKRVTLTIMALVLLMGAAATASANSRTEMLDLAEAYRSYNWTMQSKNLTGSCSSSYQAEWTPGSSYTGVTYKWGGFDSLAQFASKLDDGYGAGSYPSDGVLSCVTGVDCSGFVSRCWGTTSKYGTATIHNTSHPIGIADVVQGDAFNTAGYHIVLWHAYATDGSPRYYEANMPKVVYNTWSSWSYLSGFDPIRSDNVTGADPTTPPEPLIIRQLPYHDERSTVQGSATWPSYGCAPSTNESGPEIVYVLDLDAPGSITATITDGPGVDVDIHLLSAMDPSACVARDHLSVGPYHVDKGTWVLVVDSWTNDSGNAFAGAYTLDVTFSPDPGACPAGACGVVCGGCGSGEVCDAGQCADSVQLEPCGEVSYEGECDGANLTFCSDTGLQSGTCPSGCCGWVPSEAYYDCYDVSACGSCQDECDAGTRGCGQGNTHAWSCVDASGAAACRVRSWTPCEDGCDTSTGVCAGTVVCTPDCVGSSCGDDGCGGICGTCSAGKTCEGGLCVAACTPACAGKACGDDGCGGSCGTCGSGLGCVANQCVSDCAASCVGKVCGDDGCGGSCGSCASGGSCSDGVCLTTCVPACDGKMCGPDGCDGQCGACPGGQSCLGGECVGGGCTSSCAGLECGGDGCGGTCGTCSAGFTCESGQCAPRSTITGAPIVGAVNRTSATEQAFDDGGGCGAGSGSGSGGPVALALTLLLLAFWRRRAARGADHG